MPVSAAITFRMAMGSGYVAVMRGTPVIPMPIRHFGNVSIHMLNVLKSNTSHIHQQCLKASLITV